VAQWSRRKTDLFEPKLVRVLSWMNVTLILSIPGLRWCVGPAPGPKRMQLMDRLFKARETPPQKRYVALPELLRCAIKPLVRVE